MVKFDTKVNGNTVDATEYNNLILGLKNAITSSGQNIDSSNTQTAKAMAAYSAVSAFYTDSGSANAYILTSIDNFEAPETYIDGMEVRFRAGNNNNMPGPSTINVDGKGIKNIKLQDGTSDLNDGDIVDDKDTILRFDSANDVFLLRQDITARRNAIINGNFDIWQRGASFNTGLGGGDYLADRWRFGGSGATAGNYTISRQSFAAGQTEVPNNPSYYLNWNQTSAPSTPHNLSHRIEDVNTYSGETVTLSFYARLNSGSFSEDIVLTQNFGSGGSGSVTTTIIPGFSPTGSWTKFTGTITLPSISGKTIGTGSYLEVYINIPSSGTWNLDIAQIQINEGSVATDFENRTFAEELALCQRYYEKSYDIDFAPGTVTNAGRILYLVPTGISAAVFETHPFLVVKRNTPSMSVYSPITGAIGKLRNAQDAVDRNGSIGGNKSSYSPTYTDVTIPAGRQLIYHWTADAEL